MAGVVNKVGQMMSGRSNSLGESSFISSPRMAGVAAALTFPGFLIYHTLLSFGMIPPFFGGYAVVLLSGSALLFSALIPFRRASSFYCLSLHTKMFILFLVFALFWSLGLSQNSVDYFAEEAFFQVLSTVILLIGLFFIGFFYDFDSWVARRFMPGALIFCTTLLAANYITTGSVMFYAAYDAGELNEQVATYQGFAVNTLFIAALALGGVGSTWTRFAVLSAGLIALFFLGSRSEFIGFALGGVVICSLLTLRSRGRFVLMALFAAAFSLMWLAIGDAFSESRFSELSDIQNASRGRNILSSYALDQILNNPILGDFGGHFLFGGEGAYAHNVLSAWVSFGLLGFVLYLYLVLYPAWRGFRAIYFDRSVKQVWWPVLLLGVCIAVLALFAKPVYWEAPGLLFGLLGQALFRNGQVGVNR